MNPDPEFTYPVAERALKKWSENQLERRPSADGGSHFIFTYHGSTCNNGGTPFTALLHVEVSNTAVVEKAWIEIPENQKEAAARMCSAPGSTADEAEPFFSRLSEPAEFVGRTLESVILEDVPQNFAGCFCGRPHINQKWKIALSTIHFALT